ncbi:hypothetical protein B0H19DRAFT_1065584 [Mycena capillaripes]|nr:hypothetical protein B0H19DRAFT_1065584 [Mycena capillaripes]
MHFTRSIIVFAVAAVTVVQAASVPDLKRNWCGYEATLTTVGSSFSIHRSAQDAARVPSFASTSSNVSRTEPLGQNRINDSTDDVSMPETFALLSGRGRREFGWPRQHGYGDPGWYSVQIDKGLARLGFGNRG